jgi:hypothetical protein
MYTMIAAVSQPAIHYIIGIKIGLLRDVREETGLTPTDVELLVVEASREVDPYRIDIPLHEVTTRALTLLLERLSRESA